MAYNDITAQRVRRELLTQENVVERKMMGGLCFMLSGNMCCGVTGEALMIRVGPEAYPQWVGTPDVLPLEFAGRQPKGFVLVAPHGYRTDEAFVKWIQRSIDFASTLPVKKAKP